MTAWEIGPAAPADAAAILALQRLAYRSEAEIYNDFAIPPLTQTLDELAAEIDGKLFLKAVRGGEVVGSVRATVAGGVCEIGRLMVHPEHQKQGIGTALMGAVEMVALGTAPVRRYRLFTGDKSRGNLALYQRLGYRPFQTEEVASRCGPNVVLVWLEKAVTGS